MIFKEIFHFKTVTGATWNEVYYQNTGTLAEAARFTPSFRSRRLDCLSALCTWEKVTVVALTDPSIHTLTEIGRKGNNIGRPANIGEAAVITLSSSAQPGSRKLWMRGLLESSVSRNADTGQDEVSTDFANCLKWWIRALKAGGFIVLAKKRNGAGGILKVDVTNVDGTASDGTSIVTTKVPALLGTGNMVTMMSMDPKQFPGLNGSYRVLNVSGNTFTIKYRTVGDQAWDAAKGHAMKLDYYDTATIDPDISGFSYLGIRQTKNVVTGSRGAKRAARIRASA